MRFRKGDGKSRARAWTMATADRAVAYAHKLGLRAVSTGSAWGSQYVTVAAPGDAPDLHIRISNHVNTGAGDRQGHAIPDLSVHNETDEARLAALPSIKAAIKNLTIGQIHG